MGGWWGELDRVLRGEATQAESLRGGRMLVSAVRLAFGLIVLAALYGLCMGSFVFWRDQGPGWPQVVATVVKVPALFVLTLVVTFPSLYVFNTLVGSRLNVETVLRLVVASTVVMVAVLASLGPIVAFFGASTASYPFMKLLNVAVFALSGVLGMSFLLRTLERLSRPLPREKVSLGSQESSADDISTLPTLERGPLERVNDELPSRHVKTVFRCWVVIFGLVGAQMAWVLRPFLGAPGSPFTWFRPRMSNFFEAVYQTLVNLVR